MPSSIAIGGVISITDAITCNANGPSHLALETFWGATAMQNGSDGKWGGGCLHDALQRLQYLMCCPHSCAIACTHKIVPIKFHQPETSLSICLCLFHFPPNNKKNSFLLKRGTFRASAFWGLPLPLSSIAMFFPLLDSIGTILSKHSSGSRVKGREPGG